MNCDQRKHSYEKRGQHQHGRFTVLEHQHGGHDVMRKHSVQFFWLYSWSYDSSCFSQGVSNRYYEKILTVI